MKASLLARLEALVPKAKQEIIKADDKDWVLDYEYVAPVKPSNEYFGEW